MTLEKVWANLARGQNSKWLPVAILEITFSIIWPTALSAYAHWGFRGQGIHFWHFLDDSTSF